MKSEWWSTHVSFSGAKKQKYACSMYVLLFKTNLINVYAVRLFCFTSSLLQNELKLCQEDWNARHQMLEVLLVYKANIDNLIYV